MKIKNMHDGLAVYHKKTGKKYTLEGHFHHEQGWSFYAVSDDGERVYIGEDYIDGDPDNFEPVKEQGE